MKRIQTAAQSYWDNARYTHAARQLLAAQRARLQREREHAQRDAQRAARPRLPRGEGTRRPRKTLTDCV